MFKDFAHSPSKVMATTNAVKNQYKNRTLLGGGKDAAADVGYSSSFTYNINLISAILNTPKYFPLIFTNLGLDVLLYLESSRFLFFNVRS